MSDAVHPVVSLAADAFGFTVDDMLGISKIRALSRARYAASYVLRVHRGLSFPQIADALHQQDHSTARHALTRALTLIDTDPEFACQVERIAAAMARLARVRVTGPMPSIPAHRGEREDCDFEELAHRRMMQRGSATLRAALQKAAA
jgi:hypothetical protein